MKKNIVSKLLSITLASCLIIGGVSFGGIKSVNAAGKSDTLYLKASDMNDGKVSFYDTSTKRLDFDGIHPGFKNVCIELDEKITFGTISSFANLIFSGDKEAKLEGDIFSYNDTDLTVNKDVTLKADTLYNNYIDTTNLYFYGKLEGIYIDHICAEETALFSGASINLESCKNFFDSFDNLEIIDSQIDIEDCQSLFDCESIKIKNSSINCDSVDSMFIAAQQITIEDSDIVAGESEYGIYATLANRPYKGVILSISGNTNININSDEYALYSDENIEINGGNIVLNSQKSEAIFAKGDFTFDGDSISATTEDASKSCISVDGDIITGDKCNIKSEGGTGSFEIEKSYDLKDAEISSVEDKTYTGQPVTQSPVLTIKGTALTEGKDYTVSYSDNASVGTATITFKAIEGSRYYGETSVTFQIAEAKDETNMKEERESRDGKPDESGLTVDKTKDQSAGSQSNDAQSTGSQSNDAQSTGSQENEAQSAEEVKRSSEWVNGQWYDADGNASYAPKGQWKEDATGYWYEDESGWYPVSQWQKIDGKWYYFTADGYMDYSEYRDGYWLQADGSWDEVSSNGRWCQDSTGWWYEDDGWYPKNQNLWIDGVKYYFNAEGYWK